jgi:hypothetical protein
VGDILSIAMGAALTVLSLLAYFGGVRFTTGAWGAPLVGGTGSPLGLLPFGLFFLVYGLLGLRRKKQKSESD